MRNYKHWRDNTRESIQVGDHRVSYNRQATRWLGIWISSQLNFRENTKRALIRVRKAEARLLSFIRKNSVPPFSATHLQEAIMGSTLMYRVEVTCSSQRIMSDSIPRSINRMTRLSLGVLKSTPVSFLQTMGGSIPTKARLQCRQAYYTERLAGSESAEICDITVGEGELAQCLRSALVRSVESCPAQNDSTIERSTASRGMRFSGLIDILQTVSGEEEKEQQRDRVRDFASGFMETEYTFWTDDLACPEEVAGDAVVTHLIDHDMSNDDPLTVSRICVRRRGVVEGSPRG